MSFTDGKPSPVTIEDQRYVMKWAGIKTKEEIAEHIGMTPKNMLRYFNKLGFKFRVIKEV